MKVKKKESRRLLAWLLSVAMIVILMPSSIVVSTFAAETLSTEAQEFVDAVNALDKENILSAVNTHVEEETEETQSAMETAIAPVNMARDAYGALSDEDKEQEAVSTAYSDLSAFSEQVQKLLNGETSTRNETMGKITANLTIPSYDTSFNVNLDSDAADVDTAALATTAVQRWITAPIVATFPTSAGITKKTIKVSFAYGTGTTKNNTGYTDANLANQLDTATYGSVANAVEVATGTKLWDDRTTRLNDGVVTYHFKDTVETTTIPLSIQFTAADVGKSTVGSEETPAIKIETWADTNNDGELEMLTSTQLTTLTTQLVYVNLYPINNYRMTVHTDTDISMHPSTGTYYHFYYNNPTASVGKNNDYSKWYLSIDKNAVFVGMNTPENPAATCEDLGIDPDNPDNKIYCISILHATIANRNLIPIWNFPSEYFQSGDEVVVSTKKVVMKPWDADYEYVYVPGTANTPNGSSVSESVDQETGLTQITVAKTALNRTHTYVIDSGDLAWVNLVDGNSMDKPDSLRAGAVSRTVNWRNTGFEDKIGILGAYSLGNRKAEATGEKTVEFHFDSTDIEVTALMVPMPKDTNLTEVWYKSKTTTEWTKVTLSTSLSPPSSTAEGEMGVVLISNDATLGLPVDETLTDLKYVMPYIPATKKIEGDAQSTLNWSAKTYIFGRAISTENKVVQSTIRVYDKDMTAEQLEENTDPSKDTGIGRIETSLAQTGVTLGLNGGVTVQQAPGTIFTFRNKTIYSTIEQPIYSPVFYIRDETGCGIRDVTLTNARGVDLITKYNLTPTIDHTEAGGTTKVYKIDTSAIGAQTTADKYDAAVGLLVSAKNPLLSDADGGTLTLQYSVTIPSNYRDDSVLHPNSERVYVSTGQPVSSFSRVTGCVIGDPHNVDGVAANDAPTLGSGGNLTSAMYPMTVLVNSSSSTTYQIYTPAQLNINTEAKHKKAPDESYLSWVDGEDALEINVGIESGFDMRINWSNDSIERISDVVLYQPIPKKGEDWGDLSATLTADETMQQSAFKWSVDLAGPIDLGASTKYEIYYGVGVQPTDSPAVLQASQFKAASEIADGDWDQVNCIKIVLKDGGVLEAGDKVSFKMDCTVPEYEESVDQTTDIVKAVYYQKLTNADGQMFSDWYRGNPTAVQLCCGKIEGDVYLDYNANGKVDVFDRKNVGLLNGAKVELYKITHSAAPVQVSTVDENGHYVFADLFRGEGKYRVVVTLPTGEAMEQYVLSPQNTIIEKDGTTHHLFDYTDDEKTAAEATQLWATKTSGVRDEGFTEGGNGIYNVLFTDKTWCSLTVKKVVSGDSADREKKFTVQITLKSAMGGAVTGDFGYSGLGEDGVAAPDDGTLTFNTEGVATVKLKHGQGIQIWGVDSGVNYSVTELEENQDGYTSDYDNNRSGGLNTTSNKDVVTVITNTKNAVPSTGIGSDSVPYLLLTLVPLAGGLVYSVMRKKKFGGN